MRHKSQAQSLVEMALVLPFLLFLCFAIIDMGWYIYGYATIYNSARRGAEEASELPPWANRLAAKDNTDQCLATIYKAVREQAVMFPDILSNVEVNYLYFDPSNPYAEPIVLPNDDSRNQQARKLGGVIQVTINKYQIRPLTPLLTLGRAFGFGGVDGDGNAVMYVSTSSRRTIESLSSNPNKANGMACQVSGT